MAGRGSPTKPGIMAYYFQLLGCPGTLFSVFGSCLVTAAPKGAHNSRWRGVETLSLVKQIRNSGMQISREFGGAKPRGIQKKR